MSNSTLAAGNDPVAESIRRAVSGYAAAWLAGDRRAMLASYHDDFTLHYFGRNPLAGIHRGKPAALAILAEVTRRSNRKLSGIVDVMAGPERGALLVREIFQRDGKTAELERCWSTRFATNCFGNAGSTTRTRPSSTRFSPKKR
jgi:ketosteroid isomerase-like protein